MADGSPQVTETWVDTDGEHLIINTVVGIVKVRNVDCDPRVAVAVLDPKPVPLHAGARPSGRHDDGGRRREHRGQQRIILTIRANSISGQG